MTASPANFVNRVFFGYQNTATLKAALIRDLDRLAGVSPEQLMEDRLRKFRRIGVFTEGAA